MDHMQARDLKDGSLSPAEKAKLAVAQNKVSKDIYAQKHDAQVGNPNSASSMRMQADVQRNVNPQARIEQGMKSGSLSAGETAKLERGQAHVDRKEARAGAAARPGLELQSPCTQGFFCWRSTTLFAMPANPAAARCWWSMAGISCRNEKGRIG